jgi:hypothetical protein
MFSSGRQSMATIFATLNMDHSAYTGGGQRGPTNQMPSWKSNNFGSDLSKSRWNAKF